MAASLVKVLVHVVFSTKHRSPFIDSALSAELYPYMAGIVRQKGSTLLALGGMPDHVHALLRLKADLRLSDLVRALKAGSSKWVHEKPERIPEFWMADGLRRVLREPVGGGQGAVLHHEPGGPPPAGQLRAGAGAAPQEAQDRIRSGLPLRLKEREVGDGCAGPSGLGRSGLPLPPGLTPRAVQISPLQGGPRRRLRRVPSESQVLVPSFLGLKPTLFHTYLRLGSS